MMQASKNHLADPAVWVVAEQDQRGLRPCTFEILTVGREIADNHGSSLGVVLLGQKFTHDVRPQFGKYNVDDIFLVEHPLLANYTTDGFVAALADLIDGFNPYLVLVGATPEGQDFAPRLAARLGANIVTDCVNAKVNRKGELQFTKPTHQDKVYSTITCASESLTLATIRPGVIINDHPKKNSRPKVIPWEAKIHPEMIRAMHLETIPGNPKQIDLREAEKIVVGGRGVGEKEIWQLIEELAECLGASVGGTRMAADIGLCTKERIIGLTGKTVKPLLYVAVGVSGSDYHLRSVDSEFTIAINKDQDALIFNHCQLGVVGDLREILPIVIKELRRLETH